MTALAYGQRRQPAKRRWSTTDKRYGTYRWRFKTRLPVLRRDGYRCWVQGCARRADVCDHIDPVGPFTTDAQFYDQSRLRASCRSHNLARGYIGAEHEEQFGMVARRGAKPTTVITRDYSARRLR